MSYIWHPEIPEPTADRPVSVNRGAAAVGMIADLPLIERTAIRLLRQWCEGPAGRDAIRLDLAGVLGPVRGAEAFDDLGCLIDALVAGARRPLMRHAPGCACVGCDENAFGHLVAAATAGDHDEALAFAMALMTPACSFGAVQHARTAGLAILALVRSRPTSGHPAASRH